MSKSANVYSLLLAGANDVAEEHEEATKIVEEWNRQHGRACGARLEVLSWKFDAYPMAGGDPQDIINRQIVDDADIIVAVLWTRFGKPTPRASSGTIEEIERSINLKKRVLVYFSKRPLQPDSLDHAQYTLIKDFQAKYSDNGLFSTFSDVASFREKFRTHLAHHMNGILSKTGIDRSIYRSECHLQEIQLVIDRNIEEFSSEDLEKLTDAIKKLMGISGQLIITEKKPGSVKINIILPKKFAKMLSTIVENGQLSSFKVIKAELIDKSIRSENYLLTSEIENQVLQNKHIIPGTMQEVSVQEEEDLGKLWYRYKEQGDPRARDRLILNYAPLVKYVAGRMGTNFPSHIDESDLISYGLLGLIGAIERFDLSRDIKFETFAITRIKGSILDELRSQDWVPRSVRSMARQIERSSAQLENKLNRVPTDKEMAKDLGISMEEFQHTLTRINSSSIVALEELWAISSTGTESVSLIDTLENGQKKSPDSPVDVNEIKEQLAQTVSNLPEREKIVIALYYYEGLTMREIGDVLGVTESRISQLHTKAILRMKNRLNEAAPQSDTIFRDL